MLELQFSEYYHMTDKLQQQRGRAIITLIHKQSRDHSNADIRHTSIVA